MRADLPRLLFSAPSSSSGKTLLSLLTLAWAGEQGLGTRAFKCGPDFLDTQYLAAASGKPSYNLDPWMLDQAANVSTFCSRSLGMGLSVAEGAMGLYDGKLGRPFGEGSTATIAAWLKLPVVLVLDAAKAGQTLAATVLGLKAAGPDLVFAGVVFNRASGERQAAMLARAVEELTGLKSFGWLPKLAEWNLTERHLGLAAHGEQDGFLGSLKTCLALATKTLDFEAMMAAARQAPILELPQAKVLRAAPGRTRIAIARDRAFHFYYQENLELLEAAGAELVPFSPLEDAGLPAGISGLILGGGFPELFGPQLESRTSLRSQVKDAVAAGLPVWAECGGLMWLCEELVDLEGKTHRMAGALPGRSRMGKKLVHFGYVDVAAREDSILAERGASLKGHEFHHSSLEWLGAAAPAAWTFSQQGREDRPEGYLLPAGIATYLHLHLASCPQVANHFVGACRAYAAKPAAAGVQ